MAGFCDECDVGSAVGGGGRLGKDDDVVSGWDVLKLFFHRSQSRSRRRGARSRSSRAMSRHSGTSSGFWSRCSVARSATLTASLPASWWSAGNMTTRGSVNSGSTARPRTSSGSRRYPTSTWPSLNVALVHLVGPQHLDVYVGMAGELTDGRGDDHARSESDREPTLARPMTTAVKGSWTDGESAGIVGRT